jgi:hypothetical protein
MRSFRPSKKYLRTWGELYGDVEAKEPAPASHIQKPLKSQVPTEEYEQIKAAVWLAKNNILFYHIPNGGRVGVIRGAKLKRMGVQSGVPDICIPVPRKGRHGLYIELKRQTGGVVSDNQRYWMTELRKNGYDCFVATGSDELIRYVKNYMES